MKSGQAAAGEATSLAEAASAGVPNGPPSRADTPSGRGGVPPKQSAASGAEPPPPETMRETVESIVVAFILAFLFRTFEAEAFVIPTGSMAPTLLGRHKDVVCPQCGYRYVVGASDEIDSDTGLLIKRLETAYCPNCRFRAVHDDNSEMLVRDLPPFTGDRILVNKFPYEFGDPKRWDVVVFKYPEEPQTNYIKRLVGLPNETILIERGDVFLVRSDGQREILRKRDPDKQRRLQILVYDDDHREQRLIEAGWPRRWAPMRRSRDGAGIAGWVEDPAGWQAGESAYRLAGSAAAEAHGEADGLPERLVPDHWLRYRHIVPTEQDWEAVVGESGRRRLRRNPHPQLIGDFCGYNAVTGTGGMGVAGSRSLGEAYWVGDLTVSFDVEFSRTGQEGFLLVELNEGVRKYRCRLFPQSGRIVLTYADNLSRSDDEVPLDEASQPRPMQGAHRISFANVDQRLSVWIDGHLVPLKNGGVYDLPATLNPSPQPEDLLPVGISGYDVECTVAHLLLERDIYYRSEHLPDRQAYFSDAQGVPESHEEDRLYELLSSPYDWYAAYSETMQPAVFRLGPDEYLMLGDNSPRSRDSRLWPNVRDAEHRHAVKRKALVGKAFFVYWPHGTPFLNGGYGYPVRYHKTLVGGRVVTTDYPSFRIPFYPTVWRMRRIR